MGLDSALVDRARTRKQEAAGGPRVRGMTRTAEVDGEWFAALLQLPQGQLTPDRSQGRRRTVTAPTLMYDVFDEANAPVEMRAGERVEVDSERFGLSLWEVAGEPEPLGSLHDVFGYQVQVRRITQSEFRPVTTP